MARVMIGTVFVTIVLTASPNPGHLLSLLAQGEVARVNRLLGS